MEISNMILSGIIRVNGSGIGRVSLNPISVPMPEFFLFLSPCPAHTQGIPGSYVSDFGYTRRAWAFFAIPNQINISSPFILDC
ncbi:hypothetical protein Hanom_Chr06g00511771 [Helianthus anomalus]